MVTKSSKAEHSQYFICPARSIISLRADIYHQGSNKEDMNDIDPNRRSMRFPFDYNFEGMKEENDDADAEEGLIDPGDGLSANKGDVEKEGDYSKDMESRNCNMTRHSVCIKRNK
jgi:hypothetical protein